MGATTRPPAPRTDRPRPFERAVADLDAALWRSELQVEEIPAPQRIAPYSAAITADVVIAGDEVGTGRLILLHDPAGNPAWEGTFRCVTFARAEVDPEMVTDPFLQRVGWSWLTESLAARSADYLAASGTVTSVSSESFGQMADEQPRAEVEIRASWTPALDPDGAGLPAHLEAWADLLCTVAGLPPLPAGVVSMAPRRNAGGRSR